MARAKPEAEHSEEPQREYKWEQVILVLHV